MGVELNSLMRPAGECLKAFVTNSASQRWATLVPVGTKPTLADGGTIDTGIFACGFGRESGNNAQFAYQALKVYPYCEDGNAGFSMRVWGWEVSRPTVTPAGVARADTWFPVLLAELYCQSGVAVNGFVDPDSRQQMHRTEFFSPIKSILP